MNWTLYSKLPENEPSADNWAQYAHEQLIAGASDNSSYVFDAIYVATEEHFVLTLIQLNPQFAYVEKQIIQYPKTRAELLSIIETFKTQPDAFFLDTNPKNHQNPENPSEKLV